MKWRWPVLLLALGCGDGSSARDAAPPDARQPSPLLLLNSVNAGGPELLFQDGFEAYVDATVAAGIRDLKVFGQMRQRCEQCSADGPIDIDTAPREGTYDFSEYFARLDYAIGQKGMLVALNMSLAGRLDSDPSSPGAFNALPAYFTVGDLMMFRDESGADRVFAGSPPASGYTHALRFENPRVRAILLDYVTAVVTQFRARYGDAVVYYAFSLNTTSENEYPLVAPGQFVDTSPDAAAAFRRWLEAHYDSPAAVSAAWGRTPDFASFDEIEILDDQPPPLLGDAPRAYLDFMAYREDALGAFLADVRDRIHQAGGRAMAQYGSTWDWLSAMRGTYGFGRQAAGFDLVMVDDAPGYSHRYSMDYLRSNADGVPFGNELDAPCDLACASGDLAACCDESSYPGGVDVDFGRQRMDDQVAASYQSGAVYLDLANWDNFYQSAFTDFAPSIDRAVELAAGSPVDVSTVGELPLSLLELYRHHEDQAYIDGLVASHRDLGGPVDLPLSDDLAP